MKFAYVILMVLIAGMILVDAGKKDKLLKKLKKELGYDLKKMMKQVQKGIKKNSDDIAEMNQEEEDSCPPKPTTISPFNSTMYLGDWYQVSGLPAFFQPLNTTCVRATYGALNDTAVTVRNVGFLPDGSFDEICGYATQPIPDVGQLFVNFPMKPPGEYLILDTDYINFASVYNCASFTIPGVGMVTSEMAWILVRDPTNVTDATMTQALAAFTDQGLDTDGFMPLSQENCTYENPTGAAECTGGNWNGNGPPAFQGLTG